MGGVREARAKREGANPFSYLGPAWNKKGRAPWKTGREKGSG